MKYFCMTVAYIILIFYGVIFNEIDKILVKENRQLVKEN